LLPMTPAEFDMLSIDDRETLVYLDGVFIAARQEPEFIIRLYQFNDFYVELFYHSVQDSPVCMRSFNNTILLEPYLKNIDISALLVYKNK
jgi:hypothetical protein